MAVTKTSAPDYNNFVPSGQEMHLDKIERKVKNGKYSTRQDFLADCQKIADNAAVYNAPGNGKFGGPGDTQSPDRILLTQQLVHKNWAASQKLRYSNLEYPQDKPGF